MHWFKVVAKGKMVRAVTLSWVSRVLVSAMLLAGGAHAQAAPAQKPSAGVSGKAGASRNANAASKGTRKAAAGTKAAASATRGGASRSASAKSGKTVAVKATSAAKTTKIGNKSAQFDAKKKPAAKAALSPVRVASTTGVRSGKGRDAAVQRKRVESAAAQEQRRSASARPQLLGTGSAGVGARTVSLAGNESFAPRASELPAIAGGSLGEAAGLNRIPDPLALRSSVALVVDPRNGKILYDKNSSAVLPIASLTKLMTAMVVLDGGQPLDEKIRIEAEDRDTERYSTSHLPVGTELTRAELMQLALMSSENRAAHALARSYPGGVTAFVAAANRKAREIGMWDSVFLDPTGLSASNVSTARDLALLVARSARYPEIRRFSVASQLQVRTAYGTRVFHTTNPLVGNQQWGLTVQKTGFINEAGNCVVMQARVNGRQMIIVLLDSQGRYSRVADANRIRRFLEG